MQRSATSSDKFFMQVERAFVKFLLSFCKKWCAIKSPTKLQTIVLRLQVVGVSADAEVCDQSGLSQRARLHRADVGRHVWNGGAEHASSPRSRSRQRAPRLRRRLGRAVAFGAGVVGVVARLGGGGLRRSTQRCGDALPGGANWWLWRGLQLVVASAVVLGLAAIGHLHPAPLRLGTSAGTGLGLAVAASCALLAALGAVAMLGAPPAAPSSRHGLRAVPHRQPGRRAAAARWRQRRFRLPDAAVLVWPHPGAGSAAAGRRSSPRSDAIRRGGLARPDGAPRGGVGGRLALAVLFELFAPAQRRSIAWWSSTRRRASCASLSAWRVSRRLRRRPGRCAHRRWRHHRRRTAYRGPAAGMQRAGSRKASSPSPRAISSGRPLLVASVKTEIPSKLVPRRYAAALRLAASYRRQSQARRRPASGALRQDHGRLPRPPLPTAPCSATPSTITTAAGTTMRAATMRIASGTPATTAIVAMIAGADSIASRAMTATEVSSA